MFYKGGVVISDQLQLQLLACSCDYIQMEPQMQRRSSLGQNGPPCRCTEPGPKPHSKFAYADRQDHQYVRHLFLPGQVVQPVPEYKHEQVYVAVRIGVSQFVHEGLEGVVFIFVFIVRINGISSLLPIEGAKSTFFLQKKVHFFVKKGNFFL